MKSDTNRFVAADPEAAALLPMLSEIASSSPPLRRPVTVSVGDGPNRAGLLGPARIQINREDVDRSWTRGVLAHEYAHLTDPHRLASALGMGALMMGIPALLMVWLISSAPNSHGEPEFLQLSITSWSLIPLMLLALGISRATEYRVDDLAARTFGADPAPLLEMFDRMEQLPGRPVRVWMSTHPHPRDRRQAISEALRQRKAEKS